LEGSYSKWLLISFCALFSSLFLNIYDPLDIFDFYINSQIGIMFPIGYAGLIGSISMIFTQFVLRKWTGPSHFKVYSLVWWIILELSFVSLVIFIFYAERGKPFLSELSFTYKNTFLLAIVPYSIGLLILYFKSLMQKIKADKKESKLIKLHDEKGKSILTLRIDSLLYLKSEDNYVEVHFLHDKIEHKSLLRNTLKKTSSQLPTSRFLQIHRSYVINASHITQIKQSKGKTYIFLDFVENNPFTLSSTFKNLFESSMNDKI